MEYNCSQDFSLIPRPQTDAVCDMQGMYNEIEHGCGGLVHKQP